LLSLSLKKTVEWFVKSGINISQIEVVRIFFQMEVSRSKGWKP
jgi:hypothetical protein